MERGCILFEIRRNKYYVGGYIFISLMWVFLEYLLLYVVLYKVLFYFLISVFKFSYLY